MAIPGLYDITLPLLRILSDGTEHGGQPLIQSLAEHFGLTEAELAERLLNGGTRFQNRIAWAKVELKLGKLIETPRKGMARITDRGKQVLAENPNRVDYSFLMRIPEYAQAKPSARKRLDSSTRKTS
jgi:restriction system protein